MSTVEISYHDQVKGILMKMKVDTEIMREILESLHEYANELLFEFPGKDLDDELMKLLGDPNLYVKQYLDNLEIGQDYSLEMKRSIRGKRNTGVLRARYIMIFNLALWVMMILNMYFLPITAYWTENEMVGYNTFHSIYLASSREWVVIVGSILLLLYGFGTYYFQKIIMNRKFRDYANIGRWFMIMMLSQFIVVTLLQIIYFNISVMSLTYTGLIDRPEICVDVHCDSYHNPIYQWINFAIYGVQMLLILAFIVKRVRTEELKITVFEDAEKLENNVAKYSILSKKLYRVQTLLIVFVYMPIVYLIIERFVRGYAYVFVLYFLILAISFLLIAILLIYIALVSNQKNIGDRIDIDGYSVLRFKYNHLILLICYISTFITEDEFNSDGFLPMIAIIAFPFQLAMWIIEFKIRRNK